MDAASHEYVRACMLLLLLIPDLSIPTTSKIKDVYTHLLHVPQWAGPFFRDKGELTMYRYRATWSVPAPVYYWNQILRRQAVLPASSINLATRICQSDYVVRLLASGLSEIDCEYCEGDLLFAAIALDIPVVVKSILEAGLATLNGTDHVGGLSAINFAAMTGSS